MLFLIILIVALILIGLFMPKQKRSRALAPPNFSWRKLLTEAECFFFQHLREALPSYVLICPKVRLADILKPNGSWREQFNRVSQKHIDFVLVDPSTWQIIAAIELDDRSHASEKARRDDQFKDAAFASAQIPLHRVRCASRYDVAALRAAIDRSINAAA